MRIGPHISLRALLAGLAAAAATTGAADAACTSNVPGSHVFALPGDSCLARYGTYNPVATGTTILPFNDPGFGFVAVGAASITTEGPVTINGPNAAGADAVLSRGAGATITLTNGANLTTYGAGAAAVQADNAGSVTIGAAEVNTIVATNGGSAPAYYASGANSSISATNAVASVAYAGGPAVLADQSASISIAGGSVTTTGQF